MIDVLLVMRHSSLSALYWIREIRSMPSGKQEEWIDLYTSQDNEKITRTDHSVTADRSLMHHWAVRWNPPSQTGRGANY